MTNGDLANTKLHDCVAGERDQCVCEQLTIVIARKFSDRESKPHPIDCDVERLEIRSCRDDDT